MSADQELAATGGAGVVGAAIAGVTLIGAGIVMLWRKAAARSASRSSN